MTTDERPISSRLLTSREASRRLGLSLKSLQILRRERKIAYVRFGHRSIRFREQALTEFVRRRERAVHFAEVSQ